ncbi:hypothetical protein ACT3CD_07495 [Geofilum sp. OHC36d9]|uniref:hypothetical protein n=1 Tax=Geofilum sp. OHC36d9 TaxID=3458413 RepID=UPI00403443D6
MNKFYLRLVLIPLMLLSISANGLADYLSKASVVGDYEDVSVWQEKKQGKTYVTHAPSTDGVVDENLVISEGAVITRNGSFTPVSVEVSGYFKVLGNYENNLWGGFTVKSGGTLEIFGDLTGSAGITVNDGGILIVHGNLTSTGSSVQVKGTIIVTGDYSSSSNTNIKLDGDLIVGGNFAHAGGGMNSSSDNLYILNPDAEIDDPGWGDISKGDYGLLDDFIDNEPDLIDLVESVGISVRPDNDALYTWNGSSDTDWSNAGNWSQNTLPADNSDVTIKASGNNPVISADLGEEILASVTINSGAVLTLEPGAELTVSGDVTITDNGGLVLQSNTEENGLASFIANGTITGQAKVELTIPTDQWYYLASPMTNPDFTYFDATNPEASVYLYRNQWVKYSASETNPTIENLEGALVKYSSALGDDNVFSYTGELNNSAVTREYTSSGYNLFANPYGSFLNWEDSSWERPDISGTLWYRTRVDAEMTFITYNRYSPEGAKVALYPGDTDMEANMALIPPYQSLWIYANDATSLTIDPSLQTHGLEGAMLKSASVHPDSTDIIRIVSSNGIGRDGAVVYFSDNAVEGSDAGDARKYFNGSKNIPEIFFQTDGRSLSINGLPYFDGDYELPISVRNRVADDVTLTFDLSKFNEHMEVYLLDNITETEIDLHEQTAYTYTPSVIGDSNDRFVLSFKVSESSVQEVATSVAEVKEETDVPGINIVGVKGRAIVSIDRELLLDGFGRIEVYSSLGEKLSESEARTNKTFLVLPDQAGVYVVVVSASGQREVKKLLK